jgi:hypothetical protein
MNAVAYDPVKNVRMLPSDRPSSQRLNFTSTIIAKTEKQNIIIQPRNKISYIDVEAFFGPALESRLSHHFPPSSLLRFFVGGADISPPFR